MQYSVGSVFDAKIVSPGTISCVKVFDCTEATSRDRLCADNFPSIFYFHNVSRACASQIHHWLQRRWHLLLVRSMGAGWFISAFPPKRRECQCSFTRVAGGSQMRARLRCGVRRASEPNYFIVSSPKVSVFFFIFCYCFLHSDMRRDLLQRVQIAEF